MFSSPSLHPLVFPKFQQVKMTSVPLSTQIKQQPNDNQRQRAASHSSSDDDDDVLEVFDEQPSSAAVYEVNGLYSFLIIHFLQHL